MIKTHPHWSSNIVWLQYNSIVFTFYVYKFSDLVKGIPSVATSYDNFKTFRIKIDQLLIEKICMRNVTCNVSVTSHYVD